MTKLSTSGKVSRFNAMRDASDVSSEVGVGPPSLAYVAADAAIRSAIGVASFGALCAIGVTGAKSVARCHGKSISKTQVAAIQQAANPAKMANPAKKDV